LAVAPGRAQSETADGLENVEVHSLVGSYLAGRFARAQNDTKEAADFYRSALSHDPQNELLLEQAFQTEASRGDWMRAFKLAEELVAVQPKHRMAQLALALNAFKNGDYKSAGEHFKAAGGGPIGELTSALAAAWVDVATGDFDRALEKLDLPKQAEWAQFFLRYHRALIADVAGKKQDARVAYERAYKQDTRTLRTALAFARHAANAGDRKLALSIINEHIEKAQGGDGHPLLRSLRDSLQAGRKSSLIVASPSDGIAEVFYGLGEALIGEGAVGVGILYLQMALYADPGHQFALAALASAFETTKQYSAAIATYERIPPTSPLATAVEIRKAINLSSLERLDDARSTLTKLLDESASAAAAPTEEAKTNAVVVPLNAGELLKLKSRGEQVSNLQAALKGLGYDVDADGAFGDSTRRAVLQFQKKSGVKADGVVGADTYAAVLRKGSSAGASGKAVGAIEKRMALTLTDKLEILDSLGNILRSRKQFAEAIPYYDKAIALIGKPERRHWSYFYARGTSYERLKNWPAAEADLQKALALYPDQPLILNYLGYSWIDQGRNMKEGMTYIEKAVSLKPDDGYIVDSLGWAHYKQGNFKESVRYLERAVELRPDDAVLNEHLGDALWRVGRDREARYQWDQSLSLKPEPEDAEKLKKKIEQGLDAVEKLTARTGKQASQTDEPTQR
jgi:tetratricopeptide (TPR) repeat protein